MKTAIIRAYPKMEGKGFELLRTLTGGRGGKPLYRISNTEEVPTPNKIKISKASIVFIRPSVDLLMVSTNLEP